MKTHLIALLTIITLLSSCTAQRPLEGKDHIMTATESHGRKPSGDNAVVTFTGYLYDTYGATDIVVTSAGDTVLTETTEFDSYILQLQPRPVLRIDFINDERMKTLVLVNFIEVSERETYDVEFRVKQSVTWIKTRSRDKTWKVVFWQPAKQSVTF